MTAKEKLIQFIEDITEEQAVEVLRWVDEHFELVATEEDKQAIERARQEIARGEYEFLD